MRAVLIWVGWVALAAGVVLFVANVAMQFMGLSASYNVGDPGKFEFVLISLWHMGLALVGVGAVSIFAGRRL